MCKLVPVPARPWNTQPPTAHPACMLARHPLGVCPCSSNAVHLAAATQSRITTTETMPCCCCCCWPFRLTRHTMLRAKCTPRQLAHPKQQTDLFLRPRVTQVGGGKRVLRRLHITQAVQGHFQCTYAYEYSTVSLHQSSTAETRADSAPRRLHTRTHRCRGEEQLHSSCCEEAH
jgi:hypothetical protein